MKRAIIYVLSGTILSFLIIFFLLESQGWQLDLFYGFAFGFSWGTAYFLDDLKYTLAQKFLYSFGAMAALLLLGSLLFTIDQAVPALIRFSIVFVAYYLLASFRASKSLRS